MAIKVSVLLSLLMITYLSASLVFISDFQEPYPISLLVYNQQTRPVNLTFNTDIAFRGILLGAMRRIQTANKSFTLLDFSISKTIDLLQFPHTLQNLHVIVWEKTFYVLRLQDFTDFNTDLLDISDRFTVEDDLNYGPFLVSVNGWAGDPAKHTYWELLVKLQNGTIIRPDVGVGCYIPNPYDTVILKFTTW